LWRVLRSITFKVFMKLAPWLLVPILLSHPCRAGTTIVDVTSSWGGTKGRIDSCGQTFVAGTDGSIEILRILLISSLPFTLNVWDYDPSSGTLGNLLGTQSVTQRIAPNDYRWVEVDFQTPVPQIAGQSMAFTLSSSSGFGAAMSSTSVYSNGGFFAYTGSPSVQLQNRDLVFETIVTPVPEPVVVMWFLPSLVVFLTARKRQES
jgi:hypothetical protein